LRKDLYPKYFDNPEDAKLYVKKIIPLGLFDFGTKKIVGYTKYGNPEIGYKYVALYIFVDSSKKSKFELRSEDFEKYFRNKNIPDYLKLGLN
jgi:hypothetical protein